MNYTFIVRSIAYLIYILVSGYWTKVFITKMIDMRKFKRAVERNLKMDKSDCCNKQLYYRYDTEIGKYLFLLMIIFAENSLGVSYYLQGNVGEYDGNSSSGRELENCASVNSSILIELQVKESSLNLLSGVSNVANIFIVGLGICLMSYMIGRMKNGNYRTVKIKRYILILSLVSLAVLVTTYSCIFFE